MGISIIQLTSCGIYQTQNDNLSPETGQLCQLANVTGIALRLRAYSKSVIP
jgi:hypothetical protein